MKDYKKILEGVVDIINTTEKSDIGFANICAYIGENCPELKESEDDKIVDAIRKALEAKIEDLGNGVTKTACINWLKKQSNKDKLIKQLGEYKVKYTKEILEKHLNNMNNKDDERLRKTTIAFLKEFADKGYENAVECIDWLKNQGGKKSVDDLTQQEAMDIAVAKCFEQSEQKI